MTGETLSETQSTRPRSRTVARVAAVQALFQAEQGADNPETVINQFLRHRLAASDSGESFDDGVAPDADSKLFGDVVRAAVQHQAQISELLAASLPATWPLERLDPVLRALLRAGIAEQILADAPARVLINEYLDIAHGFFSGDEPGMVNGILDAVRIAFIRENRPEAIEQDAGVESSGEESA